MLYPALVYGHGVPDMGILFRMEKNRIQAGNNRHQGGFLLLSPRHQMPYRLLSAWRFVGLSCMPFSLQFEFECEVTHFLKQMPIMYIDL